MEPGALQAVIDTFNLRYFENRFEDCYQYRAARIEALEERSLQLVFALLCVKSILGLRHTKGLYYASM